MHAENLTKPLTTLEHGDEFIARHIGHDEHVIGGMLAAIGATSLGALIGETVPAAIRLQRPLDLPPPMPEHAALAALKTIAAKNVLKKSLIGQGYYGTFTPPVILRNVFENPGWYTAYTPYQAEIAQGRLEALLNYQQMVCDLTGMEIANASLLDEATAAAEAMTMARRISKAKGNVFFVDEAAFPQTIDVIKTRAAYFGFELVFGRPEEAASLANGHELFGALLQYPNARGEIADLTTVIAAIKGKGGAQCPTIAVASDLMALVLLKSPGDMGADIALGSSQRFGIPPGFGGPHAAFFATREAHVRSMPGRIIGVSKDARGKTAYRMALQTREQHIRREKANSNICTSQVLLANMAGMYAVWHGPVGLRTIAARIHRLTALLAGALGVTGRAFFDSFEMKVMRSGIPGDGAGETAKILKAACDAGYNLRRVDDQTVGISLDETTTREDVAALLKVFGAFGNNAAQIEALDAARPCAIPASLLRREPILTHPVFNTHHTEHGMLRYLKRLQNRDLALDHAMIPLGSCTMKLNAAAEMIPVSWPEFAQMHPFAPLDQAQGYLELIAGLENQLRAITGFDAVCMQPNSGAQGEYTGLATIRRYQAANGQGERNVCLIPKSAHGTNPASAQMAGLEVVVVACDDGGNVDVADLKAKAEQHAANLACLMITYPSTHGVFEEAVKEICAIIHAHGGQVYMDGANLNAQVGLCRPADIGADVSHINLHKTFAIPHGGGGPGMGPIGLKAHLAPFMANHAVQTIAGPHAGQHAVSAAPWGSASILPISWMYITLMGGTGLTRATEIAILNANYIAAKLKDHYPVLYTGAQGRVAHECILDVRAIKAQTGVAETDIAKRLMDYGFHAPTVSFPVGGTLMVEPTESEDKAELDRFCAAMISIRDEIRRVENGEWTLDGSPLKHAPHTEADLVGDWTRAYSREQAVFPLPWVAENKFWPYVNRIDDVWGDRNLQCGCVPPENSL